MRWLRTLQLFCITIFVYITLDAIWMLAIARDYFTVNLGSLLREPNEIVPYFWFFAILAYTLIILGILFFVLPRGNKQYLKTFYWGMFYGAIIYGVYESTNYAILSAWPIHIVVVDILWGMFVCGVTAACACRLYKSYF